MSDLALDLSGVSAREEQGILDRLLRRDFDDWSRQVGDVGYCANPVRLTGHSMTVHKTTGLEVARFDSATLPDGVAYVRCGNRRASVCPSCSHQYQGDMWHLLRAGAAGGDKGVPQSVTGHPMVFATLTAPSFGPVHTAKKPGSKGSRRCRPRTKAEVCPHGRLLSCMAIHEVGDERLGQPLCERCYDYDAHIAWQWWAPELWRRFTIALPRLMAKRLRLSQRRLRELARVSFAKVAEYQARGVVHFHAIIRLDGPPTDDDRFPAPLVAGNSRWLADLVGQAAGGVEYEAPPLVPDGTSWQLRFGTQLDARPVHRTTSDGELSGTIAPEAVAAYIAKYATKSAGDLEPDRARGNAHLERLRLRVKELHFKNLSHAAPGDTSGPYALLGKWTHMLGFRGHFASKSRRYSTTMRDLRAARKRFQRLRKLNPSGVVDVGAIDPQQEDEETTLVINNWTFAGMGWLTSGDAALAQAAAARAREYRRSA